MRKGNDTQLIRNPRYVACNRWNWQWSSIRLYPKCWRAERDDPVLLPTPENVLARCACRSFHFINVNRNYCYGEIVCFTDSAISIRDRILENAVKIEGRVLKSTENVIYNYILEILIVVGIAPLFFVGSSSFRLRNVFFSPFLHRNFSTILNLPIYFLEAM